MTDDAGDDDDDDHDDCFGRNEEARAHLQHTRYHDICRKAYKC